VRFLGDTIAAISTPMGESGIGIVRLSGPGSLAILRRLFAPRGASRQSAFPSHRLRYGVVTDPDTGEVIDEALAAYMRAPRTYTREDVVEINCHGGPLPTQRILQLALSCGARLAQPGELTLRAFVNGRLDLAQAESVMDIVRAQTDASLRVAVGQLQGHLSRRVRQMRGKALSLLAYLSASVEFAEDEIPEQEVWPQLSGLAEEARALLRTADAGVVYRQGARVAIVGRPNVGKSSLLNALLRQDRAIVTPIPGTTRDTVEETANLNGLPVVFVDTAGIAPTQDLVERLGVERSRQALELADLVLLVVDASTPLQAQDLALRKDLGHQPLVVALNKCDLPMETDEQQVQSSFPLGRVVRTSAVRGAGVADLEAAIVSTLLHGQAAYGNTVLVSNPRHKGALAQAVQHLEHAESAQRDGLPSDLVSLDLAAAADALGEVTGETVSEDLLETIFSQFCVGK